MSDELSAMSMTEVADAIRKGNVSSLEVTENCLARIGHVQPQLNCFISIEREEVLAAARTADERLARRVRVGPLHGVPLAHKDMFYRQGKVATCGSKILRDQRQEITATVIDRLNGAGALWIGGLNMGEFASDPTGGNEHWGRCHNPWNTNYVTGGSSSGVGRCGSRACHICVAWFGYRRLNSDSCGNVRRRWPQANERAR